MTSENERKMPLSRRIFFFAAALSILLPVVYVLMIGKMGESSICEDLAKENSWAANMIKSHIQIQDLNCN